MSVFLIYLTPQFSITASIVGDKKEVSTKLTSLNFVKPHCFPLTEDTINKMRQGQVISSGVSRLVLCIAQKVKELRTAPPVTPRHDRHKRVEPRGGNRDNNKA